MVVDIREICGQDKSQWLQLWQGYTSFMAARSRTMSRNIPGSGY